MKTFAIVLLAGSSTRFSSETKKQFFEINGKPVMFYSIDAFNKSKLIDEIVLVTAKEDIERVKEFVKENDFNKVKNVVIGGSVRQESVRNGLDAIDEKDGFVLIHDGARPLVDEDTISSLINALDKFDGVSPAIKMVDTIVKANENGEISSFEDREQYFRIQTPQAFKLELIKKAHRDFASEAMTDDLQLIKLLNKKVGIIPGKEQLMKITKLEDTHAIEAYIRQNEHLQN